MSGRHRYEQASYCYIYSSKLLLVEQNYEIHDAELLVIVETVEM